MEQNDNINPNLKKDNSPSETEEKNKNITENSSENQTEEPKKGFNNTREKQEVPATIKKKVVLVMLAIFSLIFTYGFFKGTEKKSPPAPVKEEKEVNLEEQEGSVSGGIEFPNTYQQKPTNRTENTISPRNEEFVFENNYPTATATNGNIFVKSARVNPLLEEYYTNIYSEELNARKSEISFNVGRNNNQQVAQNNEVQLPSTGSQVNPFAEPDINRQADKKNFLRSEEQRKIYNSGREIYAVSPYEVKAGTYIPGILISGINSDLPGNMKGQVREDIYDTVTGNHLLIPKGTTLIGTYDSGVTFGQNRALVVWQRLIFPNGKTVLLDNMGGVDLSGYAGFKDKVDNHNLQLFKAVILSSILGAGTAIVTDDDDDDSSNDWQAEAGRGAGEQVIMIGNRLADKLLSLQPTITIRPGYRFNIMLHSDLVLTPYER